MSTALWVVQVLLALVFAITGMAKLTQPRLALAGRMSWVVDATDAQVKTIGLLEVLAAIGLVAPPVLHIATFLTPLAAVGVVFLMVGAAITHIRIREPQTLWFNALLLLLGAAVAFARFGPYHF